MHVQEHVATIIRETLLYLLLTLTSHLSFYSGIQALNASIRALGFDLRFVFLLSVACMYCAFLVMLTGRVSTANVLV